MYGVAPDDAAMFRRALFSAKVPSPCPCPLISLDVTMHLQDTRRSGLSAPSVMQMHSGSNRTVAERLRELEVLLTCCNPTASPLDAAL